MGFRTDGQDPIAGGGWVAETYGEAVPIWGFISPTNPHSHTEGRIP